MTQAAMQDEPRPSSGRRAQSKGKALETLILRSAERSSGLHLTKTGVGFAYRGRTADGRMIGTATSKGQLDFVGHYQGRMVTFDAKSCDKCRLPLDMLKRHQVTIVKHRHAEGCVAFFLVEFTNGDQPEYFALTWPQLAEWWNGYSLNGTPASIPRDWILWTCMRIARDRNGIDLVGAIGRLMGA